MIIKMLYIFLNLSKFLSEVKCLFKLWSSSPVQPHIHMVPSLLVVSFPATAQPCCVLMCCLTAHPPCPGVAGHSPSASSLLFSQHDSSPFSQLCVRCFQACFSHSCWLSQPKLHEQTSLQGAFPCTLGVLVLGYLLPAHLGKDCWDWGPHASHTYGLTLAPSVTGSLWRSQAGKSQQLWLDSSSPYLVGTNSITTQCSSYLPDLEKTKFFSYHPVFMFCRLAGYEILWWSRWLTLSSHLFMISWHLVLSFVFMVRCFSSLWVIRTRIPFLKSPFIHFKTWLGNFNFLA